MSLRGIDMPKNLQTLLDRSRTARMTREQREEQRRSFAYGNSKIENERVTRKMIDEEANTLAAEDVAHD